MNVKQLQLGLVLLVMSSGAVAEATGCTLKISQSWVRAAPPGTMVMAGYAVVENPCTTAIAVVGAESIDFDQAMIHQTRVENGVNVMRQTDRLSVPAGGELRFAPNGMHLMLMKPVRLLPEGSWVRIRFILGDGSKLFSEYEVRREARSAKVNSQRNPRKKQ